MISPAPSGRHSSWLNGTLAGGAIFRPARSLFSFIRAGKFPPAHGDGVRCLTIPVKFKNAAAAA